MLKNKFGISLQEAHSAWTNSHFDMLPFDLHRRRGSADDPEHGWWRAWIESYSRRSLVYSEDILQLCSHFRERWFYNQCSTWRLSADRSTYLICLTTVLLPDSPVPENRDRMLQHCEKSAISYRAKAASIRHSFLSDRVRVLRWSFCSFVSKNREECSSPAFSPSISIGKRSDEKWNFPPHPLSSLVEQKAQIFILPYWLFVVDQFDIYKILIGCSPVDGWINMIRRRITTTTTTQLILAIDMVWALIIKQIRYSSHFFSVRKMFCLSSSWGLQCTVSFESGRRVG